MRHNVRLSCNVTGEATGCFGARVPYSKVDDGRVTVITEGLPVNLHLKKPSCYGLEAFEAIIAAQSDIKFQCIYGGQFLEVHQGRIHTYICIYF